MYETGRRTELIGCWRMTILFKSTKRALKTAEVLSRITNVEHIAMEGLKEINFGQWEGMSWEEVEEKYPTEYGKWHMN